MASKKFDWASVGGYAEGQKPMQANNNQKTNNSRAFDWASVGGYPEGESNPSPQQLRTISATKFTKN